MLRVGLTGGVACGKTTVARLLQTRGAHILSADKVAHDLMLPGQPVYESVIARFGREILDSDGGISRPKLAELAFPARIQELNALVHPAVLEAENRWMDEVGRGNPHAITVCEAALLFEAGGHRRYHRIIAVICPLEQKVRRFAARAGVPLETARTEVTRRMAAQLSDDVKAARSDYVINNDGTAEELATRVEQVWRELVSTERLMGAVSP